MYAAGDAAPPTPGQSSTSPPSPFTTRYNAEAGPSSGMGMMHERDGSMTEKRRIKRARRACLQCRSRKRKCGGTPPARCPNCLEDELSCDWPAGDGRSQRTKKPRNSHRGSSTLAVADQKIQSAGGDGMEDIGSWKLQGDWLEGLDSVISGHSDPTTYTQDTPFFPPYIPDMTSSYSDVNPNSAMAYDQEILSALDAQRQVEQFMPPGSGTSDFQWSSGFDPASFIFAVSSRIPTVEEGSLHGSGSPSFPEINGGPMQGLQREVASEVGGGTTKGNEEKEKTVKISWWRPHGHTAIAPGLKRITLKVRVDRSAGNRQLPTPTAGSNVDIPTEVVGADGMPNIPIMKHLLDLFMVHFGCQFPLLEHRRLEADLEAGIASIFLLNCIAATASRFSDHPAIALPDLERHSYGNVFLKVARDLLGSMLSVPSRETVIALVLLAGLGHGIDSESEEWMMTGMAVRMAVDLGLHLDPGEESTISAEERRLNRLTFWSVCLLDLSLSFGTGRETTFRIPSITQTLPSDEDMITPSSTPGGPRSPFPFAAKQMLSYGPLINILNGPHDEGGVWVKEAQAAIRRAVMFYNALPLDMQWSASNFQQQSRAHQASIFLQMHLWMHAIIASAYLTDTDIRRPNGISVMSGLRSGTLTPTSLAASNLWHNSARTIGDILVLSDIIDPFAYHALPFVNQAFFVAGSCYIKEVEQQQKRDIETLSTSNLATASDSATLAEEKEKEAELFRALLKSVASNNISTLQQGLAKQSIYWSGVAWVAQALEQRLSGVAQGAIDLGTVTDRLKSFVSVPDVGVLRDGDGVHRHSLSLDKGQVQAVLANSSAGQMPVLPNFDVDMGGSGLMTGLPFDLEAQDRGSIHSQGSQLGGIWS